MLAAEVLVFNALNSFLSSDPGRRALCFGAVAALSVALQCSVRPYADEGLSVNALQALCKVSWVVLAFLGTPAAMASVFGASLAQTSRAAVPAVGDWAGVFLVCPAALLSVVWLGSQSPCTASACVAAAFAALVPPARSKPAATAGPHTAAHSALMLQPLLDREEEGGPEADDRPATAHAGVTVLA